MQAHSMIIILLLKGILSVHYQCHEIVAGPSLHVIVKE